MIMFDISKFKKEKVRDDCVKKGSALFAYDAFFENKEGGGNSRQRMGSPKLEVIVLKAEGLDANTKLGMMYAQPWTLPEA